MCKANIEETLRIALGAAQTESTANIAETLGTAPITKEAARKIVETSHIV